MKPTKKEIIEFLQTIKIKFQANGIEEIALFGSYARGEESVYSDIDIAIRKDSVFLQNNNAYDYFNRVALLKELLGKKFHRNIDIFDLDSDSTMKQTISKDLIYV